MNIKAVSGRIYSGAKSACKYAAKTVKQASLDPVVRKNFKSSLPTAAACVGGFSLLSLLKNRKRDGKQGKIERNSGNFAFAAFGVAAFNKFFKNNEAVKLKDIWNNAKNHNFNQVKQILKTNKLNIIAFAAALAGVKIITNLATKGADYTINKVVKPPKLEDKQ